MIEASYWLPLSTMAAQRRQTRKSIAHLPSLDADLSIGDKENLGADFSESSQVLAAPSGTESKQRKLRSKSLGPGGIDALKEDAGNKRKVAYRNCSSASSSANICKIVHAVPKSILKPTIPLSPLKEIPVRKPAAEGKTAASKSSPQKGLQSPRGHGDKVQASPSPARKQSRSGSDKVTSDQQDEARAEEEKRERQKQWEEIQTRREARRKSLGITQRFTFVLPEH